jgi:hypothetical protein
VDDATQVAEDVFDNREASEFTGHIDSVQISIADDE